MNRLWVRLTAAFILISLMTTAVVAWMSLNRAGDAFQQYLYEGDEAASKFWVQRLATYYRARGSWEGVDLLLWKEGQGYVWVVPGFPGPIPVPREVRAQVVVADANGRVLYHTFNEPHTAHLSPAEQAASQLVLVNGQVVGRVLIAQPPAPEVGPLEERFLSRLRQMLIAGAALAGGLGVVLGLGLSRSLSSPLQQLSAAANAIAAGDLSRRVRVSGSREQQDVSRSFNEMAARLQEAERLRQNLMADVAHELRTPLSVLQGNLQAMLDGVYPINRDEIAVLHDETRLLSRLVDDVRELALADAGQLPLNLQPTEIGDVICEVRDHIAQAARTRQIELVVDVPEDLPLVWGDPDRLAQVLYNLTGNSTRHTPTGGVITMSARATGRAVAVMVRDTGEGIAPEHLPRVFDRFWRADPSRARNRGSEDSTGLGLSISQSIIKAHGGQIEAASTPRRGTTITFTVLLAR